ncbi:MAG: MarR family transcriptional regulator [Hyphomicrobiales bacterium]|nr:MAG: MarR family transcriptional regulator [Hyphomicrobiales bacterium]
MKSEPPKDRAAAVAAVKAAGRANSDATVMFHAAIAGRLGLNATDTKALSILDREGPLTAGELSRRTGLTAASVTTLIDRLERKRLARRVEDPADRRRVRVAADPAGLAQVMPHFADFEAGLDALLGQFKIADMEVIVRFLSETNVLLEAQRLRLTDGTRTRMKPRGKRKA